MAQIKENTKLRVTGLCPRHSPMTGEFSTQMASKAEYVSSLMTSSCYKLASVGEASTQNYLPRSVIIQEMSVLHFYRSTSNMDANRNIWSANQGIWKFVKVWKRHDIFSILDILCSSLERLQSCCQRRRIHELLLLISVAPFTNMV